MQLFHYNQRLYLIIFLLCNLLPQIISIETNDKDKQLDDKEIPSNSPIEQQQTETVDEPKYSDASKPKQSRVIKYRIEKEQKTPERDLNGDIKEIFQELSLNLQKQIRDGSNLMDELSLLSNDVGDDIKNEEENEQQTFIQLSPEMERANGIYDQAMKLINRTANRQYDIAYKLFKQAAELGHIGAKEELALGHLLGIYVPMDFKRASVYFEQGIENGSPQSHYGLYFMNSIGLFPNASIAKALVHLTFAAADGYHLAQMALAYRYWRSINVGYSCELALMFYQQVATYVASKVTTASGQLVQRIRLYDEEEHQMQNNIITDTNLLQYYHLLADRGDPQAQYGLGQLYYMRDAAFDKALHYFRLAAENGNTNALAYLGKLYSEKNDFIKQNNQTALQFFQRATEKGNPIGQAGLGLAYYHGAGVEQNYEKAFKLFQLSAEQSYAEGQLMLGVMFYNGNGVRRDFKMAIKWFQAAAQSGHILAYYNLAQMHAIGTGVLRSCTTATELFKNVAERGRWSNMFTEAYQLYKQGHIEQALMIYLYLAELGYEVAQSNAAYIIDQMPTDIINIYKSQDERYRKALTYWNRAAAQGFHYARIKLGDYYYYGHGTEQNYELAATHYKSASDQSQNSQAMFNLAYMHEKGLGLKRDIHLAKRFYDMAVETNADAYLPVAIVLIKIYFQTFLENLFGFGKEKSTTTRTTTTTTMTTTETNTQENYFSMTDFDSSWDLYIMAGLLGLIGALYTIRRQRMALRQLPVQ